MQRLKHAILITAYKDFSALENLVEKFDQNFNIYIHIDNKSSISKTRLTSIINNANVKCVEQTYRVNWGGVNHLKACLLLSEIALGDSDNQYFHLITGEDCVLQNSTFFDKVVTNNSNQSCDYLDYFKIPSTNWDQGGLDRLEYYNFFDVFNAKSTLGLKCIRVIQKIQRIVKFKRSMNWTTQLYGGSTYWTLSRDTLQYVINFTYKNPQFLKRFSHTFCAEEIYFQTILLNSEYAAKINADNLRFVDWQSGKGGFPAYLDESDYDAIISSNKLFARKITSDKLKELIDLYVQNQP
jgi:hypothetical protein